MRSNHRSQQRRLVIQLFTALVMAVALGVGPFFIGQALGGDPLGTLRQVGPSEPTWQPVPVELPREWRWERAPITFDHMFRVDRESEH